MVKSKERPLSGNGLMKGVDDDDDDDEGLPSSSSSSSSAGADGFKHFLYNTEINAHLASK